MKNLKKSLLMLFVTLSMIVSMIPSSLLLVNAATLAAKPANGTTSSQPFNSGTGGSTYFRIPAMITTNNGTIVTAADARWNGTGDAGGIDTMVSYSTDNGATWNYTYANYLGDNNKKFDTACATFIDPNLTYDKNTNTIYMVVDLYVGGYAINTAPSKPVTGSGFTSDGYLKVKASGASSYDYYVKEGKIYNSSNTAVDGYSVDAYYNLLDTSNTVVGNLFFSDSAYMAYPTTYLYMTKSTDNGATWSAPQLLNVKNDSEYFYGVGPGNGIVTSNGTIMIPCYVYGGSNSSQKASFIYSKDNGATWYRTANATSSVWSSESQLVELSDGTIRMFFRNGQSKISYVDATVNGNGYTWGNVVTTSITNHSNCQISAIKYSKKINGKEAILLSCPTNTSSRKAGKIFVALVNEDKTLDFNTFASTTVTSSTYQYSSLTELSNGNIGLLYENGDASIVYTSYDINTLASGGTIEQVGFVNENGNALTNISLTVAGGSKNVSFNGLSTTQALSVSSNNDAVVSASVSGNTITLTPNKEGTAVISATVYNANTRSIADGSVYTLNVTVTDVNDSLKGTINEVAGNITYVLDTDGIDSGAEYVIVYNNNALTNVNGAQSTGTTSVSITNNTITNLNESNDDYVIWKFEGSNNSFTIKNTNAYVYLYRSNVLDSSAQNCTLSGSNGSYTIYGNNRYLHWNSGFFGIGAGFDSSTSSTTLKLYKKTITSSAWSTDISKLTSLINDANALNEAKYTDASWSVLESALNTANTVQSTTHATQEAAQSAQNEVDSVTQSLYNAIQQLELAPYTEEITLYVGTSMDVSVEGNLTTRPTASIATANINGNTMTITGVSTGTTTVVVGVVTYKITVVDKLTLDNTPFLSNTGVGSGKKVTKLTTSVNVSYDLNLDSSLSGKTVVWSSADTSIATVDQNGNVTGKAVGETTVTATVDGVAYTIPVFVLAGSGTSSGKLVNLFISEITDSKVYYSENCNSTLVEVQEGEAIYVRYASNAAVGMDLFAAPNEGYALTRMSATNADGDYFALDSDNPTSTSLYKSDLISTQKSLFTDAKVVAMIQAAIDAKCDGALGFSRKSSNTGEIKSDLTFRSEKLPTIEKEVVGILGTSGKTEDYREYKEGMTAVTGETVYFKITVSKYASQDSITYSNATLTDNLSGVVFYQSTSNKKTITSDLTGDRLNAGTHVYYVQYTIKDSDLDTTIKNTVDFNFTYKSAYSSGSFNETANAEAKITATAFNAKDMVVDFALPVQVKYEAWGASTVALKTGTNVGKASYGTVDVAGDRNSGWTVTYKPNTVFTGVDTVTIYGTNNAEYTFKVYPATNVYYDEKFASYTGNWTLGNVPTMSQTTEEVGNHTNVYGYDSAYSSYDNVTAESTTSGNGASFTFTGTGVDVYANSTSETGVMMIMITNEAGALEKMMLVNTTKVAGEYDAALGLNNVATVNNAPIVSLKDGTLAYGKHTVKITHIGSGKIILDGFRVYGTLQDADDVYEKDGEASPVYTELRDQVIASLLSNTTYEGQYVEEIAGNVLSQVHSTSGAEAGALIVSSPEYASIGDNLQDFIDNSSKNELYLYPGQSLVFKANVETVQLGARALDNAVNYKLNNSTSLSGTLTSNTNMFYEINGVSGNGGYTYTITNTSAASNVPSVLAITDLKTFNNAGVMMLSLEEEDLYPAMRSLGFRMMRPTLANATANITLNDENGNVVVSTILPMEGIEGDATIMEAADILAAVKEVLPEGYEIVDEESIKDVEIIFGESADVEVLVKLVKTTTETPETNTTAPETGDSSNVLLWLGLLIASLGVLVFKKRKA